MSEPQQPKSLLLKEVFTLIKTYSLLRHSKKHAAETLAQALNRIILLRYKKIVNRLKTLGLTRRLSYVVTQSMRRIYYLIDFKMYANKKAAFDALRTFSRAKASYFELNLALQIPSKTNDKEQKSMLVKNNKAIAAMKILNMCRKLSLYNQQTIKLFRKWQLEDLRDLVKEYEENNYLLLLTLKSLSVVYIVKSLDYIRKRTLQDALFTVFKNINSIQQAKALKLTKLSNILLKKKIINSTMTLDLSVVITFKKFFKSLVDAHSNEEKKEIKLTKAINSICFSWKKSLAHNFIKFYQKCHTKYQTMSNGHLVSSHRSKVEDIQLKHLHSTLSMILLRRQAMAFGVLKKEAFKTSESIFEHGFDFEAKTDLRSRNLLKLAFSNLKQAVYNNQESRQLREEGLLLIAQVLRYSIKNKLKDAFYQIRTRSKLVIAREKQEGENNQDSLILRDTIKNQAMIAAYYERRISEIGIQTSEKRRQLLLAKILIRKSENVHKIKRDYFNTLENLVGQLKLPLKLEKLERKRELEAEKETLSNRLNMLMNGNDEALQGTDPALKYLEFIDNQHTDLQLKFFKLLSMKKGGVYSP